MTHKLDEAEFQARMQAKADLEKAHTPPNSIPGLRGRLDMVEAAIGIIP